MKKILSTALILSTIAVSSIAHAACGANQHKSLATGECVDNPPVPKEEEDAQKRKNQRVEGEKQKKQEKPAEKPAETPPAK